MKSCPVRSLSLLVTLIAAWPFIFAAQDEKATNRTVVRVCKVELTEEGRRARFHFNYIYLLRTGENGEVVLLKRLDRGGFPPFVQDEEFEPCLRSWRLGPESEVKVVIGVGTTPEENSILIAANGERAFQLVLPKR